jgi:hypothetical protein
MDSAARSKPLRSRRFVRREAKADPLSCTPGAQARELEELEIRSRAIILDFDTLFVQFSNFAF